MNELAAALDLTDNAVRAHLLSLEREGLPINPERSPVSENRTQPMRSRRKLSRFSRSRTVSCSISYSLSFQNS